MDTNGDRRQGSKGALRKKLGAQIVKVRKRRGWSQADLARRLGVQRERLGTWERGRTAPGLEDLALLSEVLEVPFEELGLGWRAEEPLSAAELLELARHFVAMTRLLKPWMQRLRAPGGTVAQCGK
jgi:transcriptional regulator with XRE-family HTH domain